MCPIKRFSLFFLSGFILLSFIFLSPAFSQSANETLTISTYYPSPYGVYKELRLYPHTSPTACDSLTEGNMYYNSATHEVMVCKWVGGFLDYDWRSISSLWTLNGTNLYPNNSTWDVGIGTSTPEVKLDVVGQVKITGMTPGIDRVLTPDAWGLASRKASTGSMPSGTSGQTLRHNGTSWAAASNLYNSGTKVAIGAGWRNGVAPDDHFQVNDDLVGGAKRFAVQSGSDNLYAFGLYQTAWSDRRLKKDIQPQQGMLKLIMALKPVTYFWKPEAKLDSKMHYGIIAQEAREIFPTLVYEDADGHLNFQRDEMQFILIQAINEQQAEIQGLKAEMRELKKSPD
jgi:hypothetical protein